MINTVALDLALIAFNRFILYLFLKKEIYKQAFKQ